MKLFKGFFILLIFILLGGLVSLSFIDVDIAQESITKDVPIDNLL